LCRISDDASAPKDAVNLNNLDDWYEFHQAVRLSAMRDETASGIFRTKNKLDYLLGRALPCIYVPFWRAKTHI
jgi:hypothetical protein